VNQFVGGRRTFMHTFTLELHLELHLVKSRVRRLDHLKVVHLGIIKAGQGGKKAAKWPSNPHGRGRFSGYASVKERNLRRLNCSGRSPWTGLSRPARFP
jgi:hypothetical protein